MNNKLKNVCWIFTTNVEIPSDIVGGILPANNLGIKRFVFLPSDNSADFIKLNNPSLIIINKCLHSNIINLVRNCKEKNIKVLSVFDDWHFKPTSEKQKKQFYLNSLLAESSDVIIVKSREAGKIIHSKTNLDFSTVPDCLRYKSLSVIKKLERNPQLLWFGTSSNHDTLIKGLEEIELSDMYCYLKIVTNITKDLINHFSLKKYSKINITLIPFTEENLLKAAEETQIVILPLINDDKRYVKSSNRIIDSFNFGKIVIKSKSKSMSEFDNYCFNGDIGEGIKWVYSNEYDAIKKTRAGKEIVLKNYSINVVSNIWKKLIENNLN